MARDKTLITGASTGIGATYADRLASRGHDLVLVARSAARMEALAARLAGTGARIDILPADLADPADLARVERRLREDASISGLVNNAGVARSGPVAKAEPAELDALVAINVAAVTRLAAAAAASFGAAGRGTIVNIASVTALMPESFDPVYLASKAYVLAFSQGLATQLAPAGVRVQAVLPGLTRTEMFDRVAEEHAIPAGMVMEAGDLVDAALAGLDMGETVTIPSLPDVAAWQRLEDARLALGPHLSLSLPASRYAGAQSVPA